MTEKTFGSVIAEHRKRAELSQKELAARVRKEDGEAISPQYLNDLEHDRRNPPGAFLIDQFAKVLGINGEYLSTVAGELPADVRKLLKGLTEQRAGAAWTAFRKAAKKEGGHSAS